MIDNWFSIVAKGGIFWLTSWSYSWSVTSRELKLLALLRDIRRLFLHAQIGTKAIFISE